MYSALGYSLLTFIGSIFVLPAIFAWMYIVAKREPGKEVYKTILFLSFLLGLAVFLINV